MPIPSYPFLRPMPHGEVQIGGPGSLPCLWIKVSNPETGQAIRALALIDTGAAECAFPSDVAERLGHILNAGTPKQMLTANRKTTAYAHTSRIEILKANDDGTPSEVVLYDMPNQLIDYTCGLQNFLLGVNNFLGRFVLKIDYPRQKFSICRPQKTKAKKKDRRR